MSDDKSAHLAGLWRGASVKFAKNEPLSPQQLAATGVMLASIVPLTSYRGHVIMTVWNDFVPTIFGKAPNLTRAQAVGLSLLTGLLVPSRPPQPRTSKKLPSAREMLRGPSNSAATLSLALLIGRITKRYLTRG